MFSLLFREKENINIQLSKISREWEMWVKKQINKYSLPIQACFLYIYFNKRIRVIFSVCCHPLYFYMCLYKIFIRVSKQNDINSKNFLTYAFTKKILFKLTSLHIYSYEFQFLTNVSVSASLPYPKRSWLVAS